jgi:hypothetical protein
VIGSTHADTLTGNGGDNMLRGHEGADTLTGAWGNDRFLWERNDLLGAARDVLTDFGVTAGDNDMLVFHDLTAADIVLSSDPMGTRISVSDPAFGGDILVLGRSPAELADTCCSLERASAPGEYRLLQVGDARVPSRQHFAELVDQRGGRCVDGAAVDVQRTTRRSLSGMVSNATASSRAMS